MRWIVAISLAAGLPGVAPSAAQTVRDARSDQAAFGARLTPAGPDGGPGIAKVNRRLDTRIDSRIKTRIERYRAGNAADPVAAFKAAGRN